MIRRRNGFADRNNINPISKSVQIVDFSNETRTQIENTITKLLGKIERLFIYSADARHFISLYSAENLFSLSINSSDSSYSNIYNLYISTIRNDSYFNVLDIIEFVCVDLLKASCTKTNSFYPNYQKEFIKVINDLFEREYIGYRFIKTQIVPITNEIEMNTIEDAYSAPYKTVSECIEKATRFISERDKDYKNSIKESISAVEALCGIILKKTGTLRQLIGELKKTKEIHPALEESIAKLYGFASDVPNVRHGSDKKGMEISFSEAKFVLVTCSAIVNYFIELYC